MDEGQVDAHIIMAAKAIRQLEIFLESDNIISQTYRESGQRLLGRIKKMQGILLGGNNDSDTVVRLSRDDLYLAKNSLELVNKFMKTEVYIPFQRDFSPGIPLQTVPLPYKTMPELALRHIEKAEREVNSTTGRFCIVYSVNAVCDTLKIHPIYALQVEAKRIKNELVSSCLKTIRDPNNICLILHLSFVKTTLSTDIDRLQACENQSPGTVEAKPSHWITSVDLGNELTVICNISVDDRDQRSEIRDKLTTCLKSDRGTLERSTIENLQTCAPDLDKDLLKDDVKVTFEYHTYSDFSKAPQSFKEMMEAVKEFKGNCDKWARAKIADNDRRDPSDREISVFKTNIMSRQRDRMYRYVTEPSDFPVYFKYPPKTNTMALPLNGLRAVIQSTGHPGVMKNLHAKKQDGKTFADLIERLHQMLSSHEEAKTDIEIFLNSDAHLREVDLNTGKELLTDVAKAGQTLENLISRLDFAATPPELQTNALAELNLPMKVRQYIQETNLKLAPGHDLDLFMFGKTGHGKSHTGNSILGHNVFTESDDTTSYTSRCQSGYCVTDGRIIKVVDTPGVHDTRAEDGEESYYDMSKGDFNLAVASCPEGFHAILLLWRYPDKMGAREAQAINMLKKIWGQDILKNYGVVIVTHGDNFKGDKKGDGSFETWCRKQGGHMEKIFKECQYRHVLFDNKTTDNREKKRQLCKLVESIDKLLKLPLKKIRYENDHFKKGLEECKTLFKSKFKIEFKIERQLYIISAKVRDVFGVGMTYKEEHLLKFKSEIFDSIMLIGNCDNEAFCSLKSSLYALQNQIEQMQQALQKNGECLSIDKQSADTFQLAFKKFEEELQTEIFENAAKELKKMPWPSCFPANSQVLVNPTTHKDMEELQVGDKVLVRNESGQLVYDTVYMFGHHGPVGIAEFLVLETKHRHLSVTKDHLVFCIRNDFELCIPARQIQEGDELLTLSSEGLTTEAVLGIACQRKQGLYAPFTKSGTLIADGTLVSCYVDIFTHRRAHKLLLPMRKLYQISPSFVKFLNGLDRGKNIPPWAKMFLKWKHKLSY